ncbi:4Fe-4S binding protein [Chloroflexota bacterium]
MPNKMALVDFNKCHPDRCEGGLCLAAKACEKKIMKQLEPYEPPMTLAPMCKGCSDCAKACPFGAISIGVV